MKKQLLVGLIAVAALVTAGSVKGVHRREISSGFDNALKSFGHNDMRGLGNVLRAAGEIEKKKQQQARVELVKDIGKALRLNLHERKRVLQVLQLWTVKNNFWKDVARDLHQWEPEPIIAREPHFHDGLLPMDVK